MEMYQLENNIITTQNMPMDKNYKGGVGHFCFEFMKKHKDKIAEIDALTGIEETYESILEKCIRTSIALQRKGVRKGDMVIIYSKYQMYASVPMISCFFIGAVPTFLETGLTVPEINNYFKQINPKLVLTTSDLVETIQGFIQKETNINKEIIVFDQEFCKHQEKESEFVPIYVTDLKETAILPFSSGSTGFPKGIRLSHYALLRRNILDDDGIWLEGMMKVSFCYDSFYWAIETMRLICSIRDGICRLIDPEPFEAKKVWYLLEKYKVNVAFLIPYDLMELYNVGKPSNLDLTNLTTIIVPGCKLSKEYHSNIQKLLPSVDIFLLYGQTEVGPLTTFRKCDLHREYNRKKPGSVGLPRNGLGISYKVVDIVTGKTLGPCETGELYIKCDSVMSGYYNLDNSDQFDEDDWFKTGDMVFYDENLCFFIVDRVKDLMIFQGWHIPPAFLEEELLTHPLVERAVVLGVPHEKDGEHPMALVVLKNSSADITPRDLEEYIAQKMPDRFQLRGGVKFVDKSYFKTGRKVQRYFLKNFIISGKI